MGRLQPSVVMRPSTTRRADRAKKAKDTINKAIPDLLRSSPRARHGVHGALLMNDPELSNEIAQQSPNATKLRIRLQDTDTLTAARRLTQYSRRASFAAGALPKQTNGRAYANVCILNMASPLRPGAGFLDGATSQEEFLCMRTTLYPSLWDDFYRLPEIGGVFSKDVMVFRDSTPDAEDLEKRERFFVDVVSAAALRFPETNQHKEADDEKTGCSCGVSYCDKDRELVTRKMRAVLRMAQSQGAEKLVLGAWGCGAYGNPVKEVAKIWKRVLCGTQRKAETWSGIKEVVFAVNDRAMLKEFEKCFSDVLVSAGEAVSPPTEPVEVEKTEKEASDQVTELVTKIQETEMQLDQISNPRSKARLREVLEGLNKQLVQVGAAESSDDDLLLEDENEEDFVMEGFANSDPECNSYYAFDEDDIASSGSASPASMFAFKPQSQDTYVTTPRRMSGMSSTPESPVSTSDEPRRQHLDETNGWYSGSINGLSALLNKPRRGDSSPVLRPESSRDDIQELNLENYLSRFSSQEV